MSQIKTCILGVGLAGLTFHAPFLLALPELFTLHSVLERSPSTPGGKLYQRFGVSAKVYRTLDQVLADSEIELVVVATPSHTHYEFAKAALNAGKHVLVDKPVTATFKQAKELGVLANNKGLVLYAYQNARWNADFLALKRLLNLPSSSPLSLGEVVEFESHYDRYRKSLKGTWKDQALPASGQIYDLGSHLIDQALILFGRPAKVTAFLQNTRGVGDPEVDDSFTIIFHYNRGTYSTYPLTVILKEQILSVRSPQLRYIVKGEKGTYVKYGIDVQEGQLKVMSNVKEIFEPSFGKESEQFYGTLENMETEDLPVRKSIWPSEEAGKYIELFKNLAAAIRDGKELAVKWNEAAAVIEMIELAMKSSREERSVEIL
ncbi:hypothetical protein BDQ17DRAFT_1397125 [Cyathus striatus]|nr:hypothetical protein BDQ17DRAFT_1397125 [Cyathus striatus]